MNEIRSMSVLPALREDIELHTEDGLTLVGELALPEDGKPVATILFLHPLPTAGGFMDSHILRKASNRLPALANIAVLRFNFRGVTSPRGTSEGTFGHGVDERFDFEAALRFIHDRGLPTPWVIGWSFGTEVALKHGLEHPVVGAILLSPPLHRTTTDELAAWAGSGKRLVAVVDWAGPVHGYFQRDWQLKALGTREYLFDLFPAPHRVDGAKAGVAGEADLAVSKLSRTRPRARACVGAPARIMRGRVRPLPGGVPPDARKPRAPLCRQSHTVWG